MCLLNKIFRTIFSIFLIFCFNLQVQNTYSSQKRGPEKSTEEIIFALSSTLKEAREKNVQEIIEEAKIKIKYIKELPIMKNHIKFWDGIITELNKANNREDIKKIIEDIGEESSKFFEDEKKLPTGTHTGTYIIKKKKDQHDIKKLPELPKFLESLLQKANKSRTTPPPFYKLTTRNNREVYIIGSVHHIHPKLLLSED